MERAGSPRGQEVWVQLQAANGATVYDLTIVEKKAVTQEVTAHNKTLSGERANAVLAAIAKEGVAASRMSAVGWGQEKPVADNRTEAGRAKNRRVELVKK